MSTAVSTLIDALITRLDAVLTSGSGWQKLPNAYSVEDNPDSFLKQGYSIGFGKGRNSKKMLSNILSMDREFIVTISRAMDATDLDLDTRVSIEKTLLEDMRAVVADFNVNAGTGTQNVDFESDNGVEFFKLNEQDFLYIQGVFSSVTFEQL